MRVVLKNDAFIGGVLYRKGNNPPANIPDSFKDSLPPGARVIDTSGVEKKPTKSKKMKDYDEERAGAEAEAAIHNEVHKQVNK